MRSAPKKLDFDGRIVMLGYGSIGRAVLPLLQRHLEMPAGRIEIIDPVLADTGAPHDAGVRCSAITIEPANHRAVLEPRLGPGDLLLNLSVDIDSKSLIELCRARGCLYLDTSTEPWPGGYTRRSLPPAQRTNYQLREDVLALRRPGPPQPTALITLGANPGLVSFLVKQALVDLAGPGAAVPAQREDWARLAQRLGIQVIHVAERDTQTSRLPKRPGEFVNTWSVDGLISESLQPAELGWGTHERQFPADGARHASGCQAAIYLNRPGAATRVRSWAPLAGAYHGFLITHAESVSIADHLTLGPPAQPSYRPTVLYAYHPCDDAVLSLHELAGREWQPQAERRLLGDDIVEGRDELGVLLMGHAGGAYWYGSQLTIDEARALCPDNNATSLQVAATVVAGVRWALLNPARGILEPDDLPHDEMLEMIAPYLGKLAGVASAWTPLEHRASLFDEPLDRHDPWQFGNFRVR